MSAANRLRDLCNPLSEALSDRARLDAFVAAGIEAANEIDRLCDMLDNRDEFIATRGLWRELSRYLSEPKS